MKRWTPFFGLGLAMAGLVVSLAGGHVPAHSESLAPPIQSDVCAPDVRARLIAPATNQHATIELACKATLQPGDVVTKRILISGKRASGTTVDCNGATLDSVSGPVRINTPAILIRSVKTKTGDWSAPTGVTVQNCTILGDIRLQGLGRNGQAKAVQISSLDPDHTRNAQAAAPTQITFANLTMIANGRIPLYIGPGLTGVTVAQSRFEGKSNGTAIYLDAESASNTIVGNTFSVATRSREQIAVDGSAHNVISGNVFENPQKGGIFLYRNCGEGGTIRHQRPEYNEIFGNTFSYAAESDPMPAIWLNSRNGKRSYCFIDPAHPFGSAASSQDFAQFNTVTGNRIINGGLSLIRNTDDTNTISGNTN